MGVRRKNLYNIDVHVAEIYDQIETQTADIELLRELIGARGPLRVIEPFCGTGRVLIPLLLDGHTLVGLDQAKSMLERAKMKIAALPGKVSSRISLIEADVISGRWPDGFDLALLGGNCLYELATAEEQERCIAAAATALNPGGYLYVDNDHMEGELHASWRITGLQRGFPSGVCADGTRLESTVQVIWWDAPRRLARIRRCIRVIPTSGEISDIVYEQQKHPVSASEVRGWLIGHGFKIWREFGDHYGNPFHPGAARAIFWAQKVG